MVHNLLSPTVMLKIKLNDHCFVVLEEIESTLQKHKDKGTRWDFQGVTLNNSQTENSPEVWKKMNLI